MCKKRTEMFLKLSQNYKVEKVEDVKELFVKGLEAVADDMSESHKELNEKITELDKRMSERLSAIEETNKQILEHIVKPRGKIIEFFGSKKFLIGVIIILVITMLSGIGVMGLLDKSSNISEIVKATKK